MAKTEEKAKTVPGLRVTARAEGFRRAGFAWSTAPVDLPVSTFTKAQVEQLKAEPMLTVEEIDL